MKVVVVTNASILALVEKHLHTTGLMFHRGSPYQWWCMNGVEHVEFHNFLSSREGRSVCAFFDRLDFPNTFVVPSPPRVILEMSWWKKNGR